MEEQQRSEKDLQDLVKKKLKEGWIKSSMFIEVLSMNEKDAKESLEQHIEKMKKESKIVFSKIEFRGIKKIDNPLVGVQVGYSSIVYIELLIPDLDKLLYLSMAYGPSNIEILEPANITISAGEAQSIANSLAGMVHTFARAVKGGMPVMRKGA